MELVSSQAELVCAIIDLITGIISVPFFLVLLKRKINDKKIKYCWLIIMATCAFANLLGGFVHMFNLKEWIDDFIWIFIYAFLFSCIDCVFILAIHHLSYKKRLTKQEEKLFHSFTAIMYVAANLVGFATNSPIMVFLVYAAIFGIIAFLIFVILAFKRKLKSGIMLTIILIPQLFGLYFQLTQSGSFELFGYTFNHNSIYHLCLLFSIAFLFVAALLDFKDETNNQPIEM